MKKYDEEKAYIQSLTEKERKTLQIAQQQLGSSFNLKKSIGFQKWKDALKTGLFLTHCNSKQGLEN